MKGQEKTLEDIFKAGVKAVDPERAVHKYVRRQGNQLFVGDCSYILDSYKRICGAIIKGLRNLGIVSKYSPINDILTNHKKISGNAQTRKLKTVLQHGTIIMDVDVEKMFSLLKVPDEKIKDKLIEDVRNRVTSIKNILNLDISFRDVADAMKKGFEEEFNINLIDGDLTQEELNLAHLFERECFSSDEWNYRR